MTKKWIMVLGILLLVLLTAGMAGQQSPASPTTKRPFTVDDALSLETLNFDTQSGISTDGRYIAYAIVHGYHERSQSKTPFRYVLQGSYVYLKSLETEEEWKITQGEENSWTPSLSPDGAKLAFYVWHNGRICIGIWNRDNQKTEYFELEKLKGKGPLIWNREGTRLLYSPTDYINSGPVEPYEEYEKVIILESWKEDSYEKRFLNGWQQQQSVLDVESGKTAPIIPQDITFYSRAISPDGGWVAVSEVIRQKVMIYLVPSYVRLDVYPTGRGEKITVFSDKLMTTPYAWSPNSRSIAYITGGKICLYAVREGKPTQIGEEELNFSGTPLWNPNGKHICCSAGDQYVLVDVNSGESTLFPVDIPYSSQPLFWDSNGKGLYFKVIDTETGRQGIYLYDVSLKKAEKLMMGDWKVSSVGKASERLVLTLQTSTMPENIWSLDLRSRRISKVTALNRHVEDCTLGKSELVEWKNLEGYPLKGVLIYPADYLNGERYPVVFWVYEYFSGDLHSFYSRIFYYLQILTNNGYAVFMPDIQFTTKETAKSFKDAIVPALDRLEEMGIADGNFGLLGHSFGGFATNIIVTQTQRFKAAIASAGQSDWVSRQGAPGHFWSIGDELGQGRLGGDLFDDPDAYMRNSPVFLLDKVTTPLMLVYGTKDFCVQFRQGEEMYYGLKNIGKTAVLIGYQGEGHLDNGTAEWVIRDFWKRALEWYDKYLKPDKP